MLDLLVPSFDQVIISKPQGFKETDAEAVYSYAKGLCDSGQHPGKPLTFEPVPEKALELALSKASEMGGKKPVVVTGSFYLAGTIKKYISEKDRT